MENLIFSLNATVPVFLMMVLGMIFRKTGWIDEYFASKLNKFVFLVPLPVLVFKDLAETDSKSVWDIKFVLFCFFVTLICILIASLISVLLKNRGERGEFIQASYRSSAALLGMALIENIYGSSSMGPLMIIGSVPLYNIFAVVVLELTREDKKRGIDASVILSVLKGIITNPILIGIFVGLIWSFLDIPLGKIPEKTLESIASTATPLGLMAMGASFDFKKALGNLPAAVGASFLKLIGFAALFLPVAIRMGFSGEGMVAILIMLGSATTVSCFVMAKNMAHDGVLTSSVVMITTLMSPFTITFWLFVLRSFGII
ncbi:MAG: AEC family transporter [Eubacterium sp.]|nr:AEC family transporter [Eubacterium sp.]